MLTGNQVGTLMGKVLELTASYHAWKAKAEQQEKEIEYLRGLLEKITIQKDSTCT